MLENSLEKLNATSKDERLKALVELNKAIETGELKKPVTNNDVNNHIHTIYSFSPYSPTKAVWTAYQSGLAAAGIVDHDSIAGAKEFIEAGKILNLATTVGFELRGDYSKTSLGNRRTNNPDQNGISYLTFHGVPHTKIDAVADFFKPINAARELRNRAMTEKINTILSLTIDYDKDIIPLSYKHEGGSITERHILYGFALKLIDEYKEGLITYLKEMMSIPISIEEKLTDKNNQYITYDLLGLLKSEFAKEFYIKADNNECPDIRKLIDFANENGIIVAYPYLGDVTQSVTGDKKTQSFEDEYLDELFEVLKSIKIKAVSYMPTRNTRAQLNRVRALCDKYDMFQISGEDINNPRQRFVCEALRDPLFSNLVDNTWALIGHEQMATLDINKTFLSSDLPLYEKINYFKSFGKTL